MEKKKVVPVWASVFLVLLCAIVLAMNIIGIVNNHLGAIGIICYVCEIITIVLAVCYCVAGYKKSAAVFFKTVVIARLISSVIGLYIAFAIQTTFSFFLGLIVFGCLCVFAVARDMGKKKSLIIAFIMILAALTNFAQFSVSVNTVNSAQISCILHSVIFIVMVYAKYKDKDARGAK